MAERIKMEKLKEKPVIPVVVIEDQADACPLAEAFLAGGLDVIEITFRTAAAPDAIVSIKKNLPEMILGAGTVISIDKAKIAIDAGVDFGLAPGLNPEIVKYFQANNTFFIPGIMTPSDIESALSLGCKTLKFFPAEAAGGVKMLKSMSAPYVPAGVTFCPTGGLKLDNMNDYLSLPYINNIGGSWLATKQQIADKQWSVITGQVKAALAKAAEIKL